MKYRVTASTQIVYDFEFEAKDWDEVRGMVFGLESRYQEFSDLSDAAFKKAVSDLCGGDLSNLDHFEINYDSIVDEKGNTVYDDSLF